MYDPDKIDDYSKKELAEMIFKGEVSREQVNEDGLFRKLRPLLDDELSLMNQDEIDWAEATSQNTVGSYQDYLDKYNPTIVEGETATDGWVENTVYIGRHVSDAIRIQAGIDEKARDEESWIKAINANTIDNYNDYISVYDKQSPEYRGQYVDEAKLRIKKLQDKIDWGKAKSSNTIESYKKYLSIYDKLPPQYRGLYVDETKRAIERLTPKPMPPTPQDPLRNETEDWAKAVRADNIEEYKSYLAKYEAIGGNYVSQAKAAIERLLEEKVWSEALKSNDIAGYKKYISLYKTKNGKHLAEAELRLNQLEDDLAWMAACKKDSISSYHDYLSNYDVLSPKYRGSHIEDAKRRISHIDDKEWEKATKANSRTAYRLYVGKFDGSNGTQRGKHLDEARKQINRIMDDACWAEAVKQDTKEAYQNYLKHYPNGIHSSAATRKITPPDPNPHPNGCLKSLLWLCLIVALLFLGWQYWNHNWPFNGKEVINSGNDTIESAVDSLAYDSIIWDEQAPKNEGNNSEVMDENKDRSENNNQEKESSSNDEIVENNTTVVEHNPEVVIPVKPSKNEILKKAIARNDFKEIQRLADAGYSPAYIILARHYLKNSTTHHLAKKYATLAKQAGVKGADEVLETLKLYDYE